MNEERFIVTNIENNTVTIAERVMDRNVATCHKCNADVIYYNDYHAPICAYCNLRLEKRCGDSACEYCAYRPAKPLPNEHERRKLWHGR